jgi:hypothetical protein
MDYKTAALCALALVSGLNLASAFRGSGTPLMPGLFEAAASSQLPSHITGGSETRALNPAMINQHRSVVSMTSESVPASSTGSGGLVPPTPLIVSTPKVVVTTDCAGFSSIPIGAPHTGRRKGARQASRLDKKEALNKLVNSLSKDPMGFPWIPLGGAAKQAGVYR